MQRKEIVSTQALSLEVQYLPTLLLSPIES